MPLPQQQEPQKGNNRLAGARGTVAFAKCCLSVAPGLSHRPSLHMSLNLGNHHCSHKGENPFAALLLLQQEKTPIRRDHLSTLIRH